VTGFLIDSGAFLAMIDVSDSNHVAAALFVRSHSADSFYVPDTVFAETMVLIKARLGARPAVDLGGRIRESRQFLLVPLTPDDHEATWTIFSRYTDDVQPTFVTTVVVAFDVAKDATGVDLMFDKAYNFDNNTHPLFPLGI